MTEANAKTLQLWRCGEGPPGELVNCPRSRKELPVAAHHAPGDLPLYLSAALSFTLPSLPQDSLLATVLWTPFQVPKRSRHRRWGRACKAGKGITRLLKSSSVPRGQGFVAARVEDPRTWVEGVGGYLGQEFIASGGRPSAYSLSQGLEAGRKPVYPAPLGAQPWAGASKHVTVFTLTSNPEKWVTWSPELWMRTRLRQDSSLALSHGGV